MKKEHEPEIKLGEEELDELIKLAWKRRLKPVKIGDNYYYIWPNSKVPVLCKST